MKLITLLIALSLLSCGKDEVENNGQNCWTCHVSGGTTSEYRNVCSDTETPPQQYDQNGNALSMTCQRR